MKYAFVSLALAALAQAQTRADIPSCALDCLDNAVKASTNCATTDYACVCAHFDELQGSSTTCVIKACGSDVAINKVLPAVQALCAAQSAGGSSAAAATTSAAATTAAAAPTTTAAAATTEAAQTSAYAVPSSAAESSAAASSVVTVVSSHANNATATPTSTQVTVPTGGAAALGSVGGLAMLALAAFAL